MLLALRSLATQACACLQPRRKRPRRESDDGAQVDADDDDDELDILIDGDSSSEADELLGARVFAKRGSKSAALDAESGSGGSSSGATAARLLGQKSGAALSVEKNLDVLRSYQEVTGMVRVPDVVWRRGDVDAEDNGVVAAIGAGG